MTLEHQERRTRPKDRPRERGRVLGVLENREAQKSARIRPSYQDAARRVFALPTSLIAAGAPYPNSLAQGPPER